MKNHVRIIVIGEASSSGSIILQAGDERLITSRSYIMLHYGEEAYPSDHPKIVRKWVKRHDEVQDMINKIYLDQIKKKKKRYTLQKLKDMLEFDTILNPKKALELGLVDKILEHTLD